MTTSTNNTTSNNNNTTNTTTNNKVTTYGDYTAKSACNIMVKATSTNNEFLAMVRKLAPATVGRKVLEEALLLSMATPRLELAKQHGHKSFASYKKMLEKSAADKADKSVTMKTVNNALGTKIGGANTYTLLNSVQNALGGKTSETKDGIKYTGLASASAPLGYKFTFDVKGQVFTIEVKTASGKGKGGAGQVGKNKKTEKSGPLTAKEKAEKNDVNLSELLANADQQKLADLIAANPALLVLVQKSVEKLAKAEQSKAIDKEQLVKAELEVKVCTEKLEALKANKKASKSTLTKAVKNKAQAIKMLKSLSESSTNQKTMTLEAKI